jgi:hypothetical protein
MADKSLFTIPLDEAESLAKTVEDVLDGWKAMLSPLRDIQSYLKDYDSTLKASVGDMRNLVSETDRFRLSSQVTLNTWNLIASRVDRMAGVLRSLPNIPAPRWAAPAAPGTASTTGTTSGTPTAAPSPTPVQPAIVQPVSSSTVTQIAATMNSLSMSSTATNAVTRTARAVMQNLAASGPATAGVAGAASSLMRVGELGVALSAFEGLKGLMETVANIAPEMAALRRSGMGLGGLGTADIRAAQTTQSWMQGPGDTLGAIVAAQRDLTSPQRLAFINAFGSQATAQGELGKRPGAAMGGREARPIPQGASGHDGADAGNDQRHQPRQHPLLAGDDAAGAPAAPSRRANGVSTHPDDAGAGEDVERFLWPHAAGLLDHRGDLHQRSNPGRGGVR